MDKKQEWSGILGSLIAAIGSAVGLGNYWRMPYLASQYGYIPFFIAFIVCVMFVGLPIMFVELTAGRIFKKSFIETYKKLKFPWPGYISFILMVILCSYYMVIAGWIFMYVVTYPFIVYNFSDLITHNIAPVGYIFVLLLSAIPIYFGVQKGIESFSKIIMALLVILTILILAIALSENPIPPITLELPTNLEIWIMALSQSFFSLSVGFGILFTYSTYIKQKTSIMKDSIVIGFFDVLIGLAASFLVFVLLGGVVSTEGPTLVFDVLSGVFKIAAIGWLFYLCLLIAAITSVISLLEFIVSNLQNYGFNRKKALFLTVVSFLFLSLPSALSYSSLNLSFMNIPVLDILDRYVIGATSWVGIFFIAFLLQHIKEEDFVKHLDAGRLGKPLYIWCKYILLIFGVVMAVVSTKFLIGW